MSDKVDKNYFKNKLSVEIDSESTKQILISKPSDINKPKNEEEIIKMLKDDLKTLCLAINELIYVGHVSEYFDGNNLIEICKKEIESLKEEIK